MKYYEYMICVQQVNSCRRTVDVLPDWGNTVKANANTRWTQGRHETDTRWTQGRNKADTKLSREIQQAQSKLKVPQQKIVYY